MCTVKRLTVVDFLRLIDATNIFHHAKLSENLSKKQMEQFSRFFSFIGERRSFHFLPSLSRDGKPKTMTSSKYQRDFLHQNLSQSFAERSKKGWLFANMKCMP